jgi:hypothetical protein
MPNQAITSLNADLKRTFEDPRHRPPPLPAMALELHALAMRSDVELEDVVRARTLPDDGRLGDLPGGLVD